MVTMFDSTTAGDIPADAEIVAGYVDGDDAWTLEDWAQFPNSYKVGITVKGAPNVRVGDCEEGAIWPPANAAKWGATELAAGRRPTLYVNVSTWGLLIGELERLGIHWQRVDWWVASWGGGPHRLQNSVATQFASPSSSPPSGGHYDLSLTNGIWPDLPPTPPAPTTTEGEEVPMDFHQEGGQDHLYVYQANKGRTVHYWQNTPGTAPADAPADFYAWHVEILPEPA